MTTYLAGSILSASMIFTGVASAMQIPEYEKMAQVDKDEYRIALVEGAVKALNDHGQPDQAQKLTAFFLDKSDNGGFIQLRKNLEVFKDMNKENAAKPDNNKEPIYEVEHALALTLKNHGISVPVSILLAINKDFKPSQPAVAVPAK